MVLNALLQQVLMKDEESVPRPPTAGNPIDDILAFAAGEVHEMVAQEALSRPILAGLSRLDGDPPLMTGAQWVAVWRSVVDPAFKAGLLHDFVDPELVSRALHLMIYGASTKWTNYEVTSEQFAADVVYSTSLMLLGVASENGQPLLRHRFAEAEQKLQLALKAKAESPVLPKTAAN